MHDVVCSFAPHVAVDQRLKHKYVVALAAEGLYYSFCMGLDGRSVAFLAELGRVASEPNRRGVKRVEDFVRGASRATKEDVGD